MNILQIIYSFTFYYQLCEEKNIIVIQEWNQHTSYKLSETPKEVKKGEVSIYILGNPVMIWLKPLFWWSCVRVQKLPSRCDGYIKWRTVSPLELLWGISNLCSLLQDQFPLTSDSKLSPKKVIVWLSSTTFLEVVQVGGFFFLFFFPKSKLKLKQIYSLYLPIKGQ